MNAPESEPARAQPAAAASPTVLPSPPAEVFVIHGAEPEVNAYSMARYSRSALSMRASLAEIDGQRAEKFLNTFYFQYGHRSIADLAHLSIALEHISILAAIDVVDESRWDGQERSTRYQEFRRSGYYQPPELAPDAARSFVGLMERLFADYESCTAQVAADLEARHPRPESMLPEAYRRTLRARAFDASRGLLPLATATSLGQIVNARTLEQQIVRLLSSPLPECRRLGAALKQAAAAPAYDVRGAQAASVTAAVDAAVRAGLAESEAAIAAAALARPVRAAPTLVKYADPSPYLTSSRAELSALAAELLAGLEPESTPGATLCRPPSLEIELAATLLYPHCHHAYSQLLRVVEALPPARRREIVQTGLVHRGPHDELLREYQAGAACQFDILMDIGGFRDLHRHRRCVQIHQGFTCRHGYVTPSHIVAGGVQARYAEALEAAARWVERQAASDAPLAPYGVPLAYRKRSLFKMDVGEAAYIAELRSAPAGHFSYRQVAWQMQQALLRLCPDLAGSLRVREPKEDDDPLQR